MWCSGHVDGYQLFHVGGRNGPIQEHGRNLFQECSTRCDCMHHLSGLWYQLMYGGGWFLHGMGDIDVGSMLSTSRSEKIAWIWQTTVWELIPSSPKPHTRLHHALPPCRRRRTVFVAERLFKSNPIPVPQAVLAGFPCRDHSISQHDVDYTQDSFADR